MKTAKVPRAEAIARELGLDFRTESTRDGKWLRFFFVMPDVKAPAPVGGIDGHPPEVSAKMHTARTQGEFAEATARITKWRERVKAWLFDPQPVGESGIIVAAELSTMNRYRVWKANRANRAAMERFWSGEAMARRAALAQPTPEQGLFALKEQLAKYGIKTPEPETVKLQAALQKASAIVALDGAPTVGGVQ